MYEAFWAIQDGINKVYVFVGTLFDDKKFRKYFGFGVGSGYSGQYKKTHKECLWHAKRMIKSKKINLYFGCGVGTAFWAIQNCV